eukprot:scaffold14072_cov121-Isochrysis_galbana.AAC.2
MLCRLKWAEVADPVSPPAGLLDGHGQQPSGGQLRHQPGHPAWAEGQDVGGCPQALPVLTPAPMGASLPPTPVHNCARRAAAGVHRTGLWRGCYCARCTVASFGLDVRRSPRIG